MIGRDSSKDMNVYGHWPWFCGVILAAVLISIMFALARGFA